MQSNSFMLLGWSHRGICSSNNAVKCPRGSRKRNRRATVSHNCTARPGRLRRSPEIFSFGEGVPVDVRNPARNPALERTSAGTTGLAALRSGGWQHGADHGVAGCTPAQEQCGNRKLSKDSAAIASAWLRLRAMASSCQDYAEWEWQPGQRIGVEVVRFAFLSEVFRKQANPAPGLPERPARWGSCPTRHTRYFSVCPSAADTTCRLRSWRSSA